MVAVGGGDKPPLRAGLQVMFAHQTPDFLMVADDPAMPELGAHAAVAVGLELICDRTHELNDRRIVDCPCRPVVVGRARDLHQPASFGDGEPTGPVITDVGPLLGRGVLLSAPFRNSISSACLPTNRSSAAIRASYSWTVSAAWASSSKAPASYFCTQIRIRLRETS